MIEALGNIFNIDMSKLQTCPNVQQKKNKCYEKQCYSRARINTQQGKASYYVEGFLILPSMGGFEIPHAWYVDTKGKHIDESAVDFPDAIYKGFLIPADKFNENMKNSAFADKFNKYAELPYQRTCKELFICAECQIRSAISECSVCNVPFCSVSCQARNHVFNFCAKK